MKRSLEQLLTDEFVASNGFEVPGSPDESIILVPPPANPKVKDDYSEVRKILKAGERVYPNDRYFMKRFGHVGYDKLDFALVAPGRVRAGVAIHVLCLPEESSVIDLSKLTLNSDTVRKAAPALIENSSRIKVLEPYAITNLGGGDEYQPPDDPAMSRGSGKRLMGGLLRGLRGEFYVATISPKIRYSSKRGNMSPLKQAVSNAIAAMDAERKRDTLNIDPVQKFHMGGDAVKGAAGIAAFVFNSKTYNPRYGYGSSEQMLNNQTNYRDGVLPIAEHLFEQLPSNLQDRCFPMPSRISVLPAAVQPMRLERAS